MKKSIVTTKEEESSPQEVKQRCDVCVRKLTEITIIVNHKQRNNSEAQRKTKQCDKKMFS